MHEAGLTVTGPDRLSGVDIDLHDVGELTPTVAALAALADGPSVLRGIAHLRGHETDRLAALVAEINGAGRRRARDRGRPGDPPGHAARRHRGTPTPTTGWPPRARSSGWSCRASRWTTSPRTAKTLPDFPAMWQAMLDGTTQ